MENKDTKVKTPTKKRFTQNDINAFLRAGSILIGGVIISLTILFSTGALDFRVGELTDGPVEAEGECSGENRLREGCYVTYAKELDLNVKDFEQCIEEERYDDVINSEIAAGEAIGVSGTPSIYIGKGAGEEFKGFYLGGARYQDIELIVGQLEDSSIEEVNKNWQKLLEDSLVGYKAELEKYYASAEGGSLKGKELEKTVSEAIAEQKKVIKKDYKLRDLSTGDGQVQGDAEIVLLEFSDYECPYCYTFANEVLVDIKANFVETGKMRYIFRDFPLDNIHPKARPAAIAARCSGEQGKYFEYHDKLFSINSGQ